MALADVPELEPSPFDVHQLIGSANDRFAPIAQEKDLRFEIKRSARVPRRAIGEEIWLREVLHGLIGNAVRFTDAGEVVASVTADPTGGSRILLHAEISDTGCGIPTEVLRGLFQPTVGGLDVGADGAGRSLRIYGRLIDLMDGRIGASSAVGLGTTTWFTVPLDVE